MKDIKAGSEDELKKVREELIETKARLAMIEPLYWQQKKMLNDNEADATNYKDLYQAAKQENEELKKKINLLTGDSTDYKSLYLATVREKRKALEKLNQIEDPYKAKYLQAIQDLKTQKKEFAKLMKTLQSERERKLRSRIESLENLIMRYKAEGAKALMQTDII